MTLWGQQVQSLPAQVGDPAFGGAQTRNAYFNMPMVKATGPVVAIDQGKGGQGPFLVTLAPLVGLSGTPMPRSGFQPDGLDQRWRQYGAFVEWGRGGQKYKAMVDWPFAGGTFVVNGDSLYVTPCAWFPLVIPIPTEALTVCGASAQPVLSGRDFLPPRFTMYCTDSPGGVIPGLGGTTTEIFLPPFARRVMFQWNNDVIQSGAWSLRFLWRNLAAGTFAQEQIYAGLGAANAARGNAEKPYPFEVPPNATNIVLQNGTNPAVDVVDPALVFDLDLS